MKLFQPEGEFTGPRVPVVERDLKFPLVVRNKGSEDGKLELGN